MSIRIALDALGGDQGASVVVPAALSALRKMDDLELVLVGDRELLEREVVDGNGAGQRGLTIHHASQKVEMGESPTRALRTKKDSSMRVAIDLVKQRQVDACVSAGNTGALMATARFVLKTLPGIDRPAICTVLPTIKGHAHMLDLGANVDVTARHLFQFAVMGSILTSAVDESRAPRIGLLNIGEEEIKGNEQVKQAARLLESSAINYIGFVEGDDIYKGKVDVVVCDGFVGNVALKASEGVAAMIRFYMRQAFTQNLFSKLTGWLAQPALKALGNKIDPRRYNGASMLGLQGIVIKSHGNADSFAFGQAIKEAVLEVRKNVPQRISKQLSSVLIDRQAV